MKSSFHKNETGYQESIRKGLSVARRLSGEISFGTGTSEKQIRRLREEIQRADAILIGAGAGLSTSAGLTYNGERFKKKADWDLIRDDMKLDNIYLTNILEKDEYPERIPAEDVKKYAPKDLMVKMNK